MIDFINPRSKKMKHSLIVGLFAVAVLFFGMGLTYQFVNEYIQAKTLTNMDSLPSGDIVIEGLDTKDLLDLYKAQNKDTSPSDESISKDMEEESVIPEEPIKSEEAKDDFSATKIKNGNLPNENSDTKEQVKTQESQTNKKPAEAIPAVNTLVVPQMGVRGKIYEGQTEKSLLKGLWRMPMTSDDPASGNMVVTAHRYLRRPPDPNTFYLLDKLKVGDEFYMYWEGKRYDYKVREIKIVDPDQIDILYNTPNPQITLFSCTPLFTSAQRLVVIADLVR